MPFLVFCLIWVSIFKLVFDLVWSDLQAPFSLFVEYVQWIIMLAMVIITINKKRQGKREELIKNLEELRKKVQ